VDDRGIDIVDAVPQVANFGNGIGRIHYYTFSFLPNFCDGGHPAQGGPSAAFEHRRFHVSSSF
jgi:hypothetical protein